MSFNGQNTRNFQSFYAFLYVIPKYSLYLQRHPVWPYLHPGCNQHCKNEETIFSIISVLFTSLKTNGTTHCMLKL